MPGPIRILNRTLIEVLGDQPQVGFTVLTRTGTMVICNHAARRMYYGTDAFDPIGRSVRELEGDEFAAELLSAIEQVCLTCESLAMDHIRFGRRMKSIGWPVRTSSEVPDDQADAVLAMSTLVGVDDGDDAESWGPVVVESSIVSWGALEPLTARELEVLAKIGEGKSQKGVAESLGITRKTVETHRARIGLKLNARSSTELARIACESGFSAKHAKLRRQEQQAWMQHAIELLVSNDTSENSD